MPDRPPAFPLELWGHLLNLQNSLVKERWEGYDPKELSKIVSEFLAELTVSDERQYTTKYFRAQALANMDRFIVNDKDGIPPLIHSRYTHKVELVPGTKPRKEAPKPFSGNQNAYLRAKLSILESQGRIDQKDGLHRADWLHRWY